jgi:alkaline phosphatase
MTQHCRGSLVLFFGLILSTAGLTAQTPAPAPAKIGETKEAYMQRARAQVEANRRLKPNTRRARNVILFVGDGMGVTTITAARVFEGQMRGAGGEENFLSFERFPYLAHSKTYQNNQQVPDSAPTMTALITGSKANDGMLSIAPNVFSSNDWEASMKPENRLETILEQAEKKGMWTGVVSTARLTHATPGACYAHVPNRDWESDANLSPEAAAGRYPDIASQLVDFKVAPTRMNGKASPGLELAMGGGRAKFLRADEADPEEGNGERKARALTREWQERGGTYVWDRKGFDAIDPAATGPVLALFEPSHMEYELDRAKDKAGEPSLTELTEKAIRILQRGPKGFFLMVEAGRIDHAHHGGNAKRALMDTAELSRAVRRAAELTGRETLIIVTADHSHAFTMSGYPTRGNPVLGLVVENNDAGLPADKPRKALDGKPYTTLGYANGPGAISCVCTPDPADPKKVLPDCVCEPRDDLSEVDTTADAFQQQALVPLGSETHGGEDVAIYARGPWAHLVQGTMEQNAVYWVMSKALGWW